MSHVIYDGIVHHGRTLPKKNSFRYKSFYVGIDVTDLEKLTNRYFSLEKWNLYSFFAKDHFGSSGNLKDNIMEILKTFDLPAEGRKFCFVTLPRMFGFVFNPVSFLIVSLGEKVERIIAEVHNFEGGRALYPLVLTESAKGRFKAKADKDFYVSPFFTVEGHYDFEFDLSPGCFEARISLNQQDKTVLVTSFKGSEMALSERNLIRIFCKHGFLTFYVITRTVYQAFKIRFKGIKQVAMPPGHNFKRY